MNRVASVLGVAAAGLLATACATQSHDMARTEARTTLASSAALNGTNAAEVVGKTAMFYGDRYTATNLFERAADKNDTVGKRFNMAAGYESTGRLAEAAALYRVLAVEGEYTYAISGRTSANPDAPLRRFNVADESARRLARITVENPLVFAQYNTSGSGALAAGAFATPVSATVGGAPVTGRISDEEALRRDAQLNGGE